MDILDTIHTINPHFNCFAYTSIPTQADEVQIHTCRGDTICTYSNALTCESLSLLMYACVACVFSRLTVR